MSATAQESGLREALAEAAAWRLIGLLFERPRAGWIEEVASLAREVADPALRSSAGASRAATEGAYIRLLGPGGDVSPREVAYRGREDPGRILADLSAFYEAFAYRPRAEDPIDHVAVEAGFAGYLRLKEAYALASGDAGRAGTAADALRRFTEEHLRSIAGPLARRLESAGAGYLAGAARSLVARAGDAPEPLPILAPADEAAAAACAGDIPACAGGDGLPGDDLPI